MTIREKTVRVLRWSERYAGTDMVYLARGGFWMTLSSGAVTLFAFLLYIAFARFLPKEVYGMYQYLLSLAAIVGAFTLTGMNTAVSRAVARGQEGAYRASIRTQFHWSLLPLCGALCGAAYYFLNGNIALAAGLVLIGVATPFVTTFNTYHALLTGRKDFRRLFLYSFTLNIFYYGGLALAAWRGSSVLTLLAVNFLVNAFVLAFFHFRLLATIKPDAPRDEYTLSDGTHLSVMGLCSAAVSHLDSVLVFHYLGAAELAIYSLATAIPDRLANLARFLPAAAMPKFAEGTEARIRASIGPKLVKLAVAAAVAALCYSALAPLVFRLFFPAYTSSVPFSALYGLSLLGVCAQIALAALAAHRRTTDLYIYHTLLPALQIALMWSGVLLFGLWGLVIGKTLGVLLGSALAVFLLLRKRVSAAPSQPS